MKKLAMLSGALATKPLGWVYAQTDVEQSDFDGSETADFGDFLIFAQNFGRSTDDPEVTFLYVADTVLGEVRAYNAATNFQDASRQINVPFPRDVEYAADTNRLYVSALDTFYAFTSSSTPVFTIPLTEESDLGFVTSRGGSKMAVSPDQRTAYISEQLPAVEVVNLETAQSEALIIVRPNPAGIGVSPDGSRIYVTHGPANNAPLVSPISVIDTESRLVVDTLSVGEHSVNRIAVSPGCTLFTNSALDGVIQAIEPSTGEVVRSADLATESDLSVQVLDIALSPDELTIYVPVSRVVNIVGDDGVPTIGFSGGLVGIDAATFVAAEEIAVGEIATNVALSPDGTTAYVTGSEDPFGGSFQVFVVDFQASAVRGSLLDFTVPAAMALVRSKSSLVRRVQPDLIVF